MDPDFDRPVVDSELDVEEPIPHRVVAGRFEGTEDRFCVYLPSNISCRRFIQSVYPLDDETASDSLIAFAAASDAYVVQTSSSSGYRVDAAAAKFSRTIAAAYYHTTSRIYGYIFGASGGSFQTIGGAENTEGVWDGAVPIVMGVGTSIPNNFFIRVLARHVLADRASLIADAVAPGGSGDPFAGLNPAQREVLQEITSCGFPLRAWEDPAYLFGRADHGGLLGFAPMVKLIDPTYAADFWTAPGYLGTETSPLGALIRELRVDHTATIQHIQRDRKGLPIRLVLDAAPVPIDREDFEYTLIGADGADVGSLHGTIDDDGATFQLDGESLSDELVAALVKGGRLRIDNRWSIALGSYSRHQVPSASDLSTCGQYRAADGQALYPQRSVEVGPLMLSAVAGGDLHTGAIGCKVIAVSSLLDADAFPWHADCYASRVHAAIGERFNDNFRLWFSDHADHHTGPVPPLRSARIVPYSGIVEQALRDVAAWAEDGIAPLESTRYEVRGGQVELPESANERGGIQPVVTLLADGVERAETNVGQTVTFRARIDIPTRTGSVIEVAWDVTGCGEFIVAPFGEASSVETEHAYTAPGTYFPSVRVTTHRDGDTDTAFARVQTLGRARVIVGW